MLTVDVLQTLKIFLDRVQLSGNEVPAYNKCTAALRAEEVATVEAARQAQAAAQKAASDAATPPTPPARLKAVPDKVVGDAEAPAGGEAAGA